MVAGTNLTKQVSVVYVFYYVNFTIFLLRFNKIPFSYKHLFIFVCLVYKCSCYSILVIHESFMEFEKWLLGLI